MASSVYEKKEIRLQDDTDVVLRPLPVGRLRKFMEAWQAVGDVKEEDELISVYIDCCGIALERELGEKFEQTKGDDSVLSDEYREYLEDVLDIPTIYEILDVCGGLKLNDPKLMEAAQEAALAAAAGKN